MTWPIHKLATVMETVRVSRQRLPGFDLKCYLSWPWRNGIDAVWRQWHGSPRDYRLENDREALRGSVFLRIALENEWSWGYHDRLAYSWRYVGGLPKGWL